MKSFLTMVLTVLAGLLFLVYGVGLIILGYLGIEDYLGTVWAIGFTVIAFMFRFSLPMIIGAVYGAMQVFNIEIWLAVIIVMPTLVFMLPALIGVLFAFVVERFRKPQYVSPVNDDYIDTTIVDNKIEDK